MNVFLNPFQDFSLIFQTDIEVTILLYLFAGEKAVYANAVVESNDDHAMITCFDEFGPIPVWVRETVESTPLEPNEDRLSFFCTCWCIDVKEETVFRVRGV